MRRPRPLACPGDGLRGVGHRLAPRRRGTAHHDHLKVPSPGGVESYKRLADVFHQLLAEQELDTLLEQVAATLGDIVPYDTLTVYEAEEPRRELVAVYARDRWADQILGSRRPRRSGHGRAGTRREGLSPRIGRSRQ